MVERTRWPDERIDDFVAAVWKAINGVPDRVKELEVEVRENSKDIKECHDEVAGFRADFTASRQGMSLPEKLALAGVLVAFFGVIVSGIAVFL